MAQPMPGSCSDSIATFDDFESLWLFFLKQGTLLFQVARSQTMFTVPKARKVLTILFYRIRASIVTLLIQLREGTPRNKSRPRGIAQRC